MRGCGETVIIVIGKQGGKFAETAVQTRETGHPFPRLYSMHVPRIALSVR